MQNLWPWVLLGLLPYEVTWQQVHKKRTLTLHAMYWSLILSRRHTKKGQGEHYTWAVRLLLVRLHT